MPFDYIGRKLTREEFTKYIETKNFGMLPANKLVIHHTWSPTKESWNGKKTLDGIKNYYVSKGWKSGPHIFAAEDGIWLFTDMRNNGTHAGRLNWRSIGVEIVGNYDNEVWQGETKLNALHAILELQKKLNIKNEKIFFHRDVSGKTCPGKAITKQWLFENLRSYENGKLEAQMNYVEERKVAWEWFKELAKISQTEITKPLSELDAGWLAVVVRRIFKNKGL